MLADVKMLHTILLVNQNGKREREGERDRDGESMEHIAGEYDGNTCTTKWDEEMVVAQDGMMRTDGQVPQDGSERECQVQHVDKLSSPELAQEGLHGE